MAKAMAKGPVLLCLWTFDRVNWGWRLFYKGLVLGEGKTDVRRRSKKRAKQQALNCARRTRGHIDQWIAEQEK